MKTYKKIFAALPLLAAMVACTSYDRSEFSVDKPQSIAQFDYLKDYGVLKSYVDRANNPKFKLGAGVSLSEYNAQGAVFRMVNDNFDEITVGYDMKHGAVVKDNGTMNFDNINLLLKNASDAGVTVYGHTLCWHQNQKATYLNGLLADLIVEPPAFANELDLDNLRSGAFTGWTKSAGATVTAASGGGMVSNTSAIKLVSASSSSAAGDLRFTSPSIPVVLGHTYEMILFVRSDSPGKGRISFEGLNDNEPRIDWMATGTPSESFSTIKAWRQVRFRIKDFQGSSFKFNLDFGYLPNTTYYVDINNIYLIDTQGEPAVNNLVKNGDFEEGNITGWGGWGNSVTFNLSASGEGMGGNGYALKVFNPSTTANYYGVQSLYTLSKPLINGATYNLSFWIKGSATGKIRPEAQSSDYSSNGFGTVDITTQWQQVNLTTTISAATRDRLIISYGEFAGTLFIDNVMLNSASEPSGVTIIVPKTADQKKELISMALESWIAGMVTNCKGSVKAWDVVNEPMSDWPDPYLLKTGVGKTLTADEFYWQDYLGKDYAVMAFQLARQYGNPEDIHFINDYNLEVNIDKCKGLIKYVQYIESQGGRVDGIGTQMHLSTRTADRAKISEMFRLLAETGKIIKISELDMGIGDNVKTIDATEAELRDQADLYDYVIKSYLSIVPVSQRYGITMWSPVDSPENSSWRKGEPIGLWTLKYVRKHAYAGFAKGLAGK